MKDFGELVALARAKPGVLNYGSSGVGSIHHLSMESLKSALGLEIVHIPYKGTGQSIPALVSGDVTIAYSAMPSIAAHVKAGRVKVLAVSTAKRSPTAPDVPTVAELGVPGYDFAPEDRAARARGHAARDRGAHVAGGREGGEVAGGRAAVRAARHRAGRQHARGVRRAHPRREREVRAGGEGVGRADRLKSWRSRSSASCSASNHLGEGPVWDVEEGRLYWVDGTGRRVGKPSIWRLDPRTGKVENWSLDRDVGALALRRGGGAVLALDDGFYFFDFDERQARPDRSSSTPSSRARA